MAKVGTNESRQHIVRERSQPCLATSAGVALFEIEHKDAKQD